MGLEYEEMAQTKHVAGKTSFNGQRKVARAWRCRVWAAFDRAANLKFG